MKNNYPSTPIQKARSKDSIFKGSFSLKSLFSILFSTLCLGILTSAGPAPLNHTNKAIVLLASTGDFVITIKTDNPGTSGDTSFTIPTTGGGYNYDVDWNNDNTTGSIDIAAIVGDSLNETNETVIVTLGAPSYGILGTNTIHTYTIDNNDAAPTIAFDMTVSNDGESVTAAILALSLSAVSEQDVGLSYTITGMATGGGIDYSLADGSFTITAANTTDTIDITSIVDDLLDETNETVIATISAPINASLGANTVHTYTIDDNETILSQIANEGDSPDIIPSVVTSAELNTKNYKPDS